MFGKLDVKLFVELDVKPKVELFVKLRGKLFVFNFLLSSLIFGSIFIKSRSVFCKLILDNLSVLPIL